jgi:type I thyroxine 5'-deiodinase
MYEKYRGKAAFYVVYIGEAHPADAWQLPSNVEDKVIYESPKNLGERTDLAEVCVTKLGIKLPAIVDRFDDAVDRAYSGWPDRLYLIDKDGRVAYKSRPGPFGFKPADLEAALTRTLGPDAPTARDTGGAGGGSLPRR